MSIHDGADPLSQIAHAEQEGNDYRASSDGLSRLSSREARETPRVAATRTIRIAVNELDFPGARGIRVRQDARWVLVWWDDIVVRDEWHLGVLWRRRGRVSRHWTCLELGACGGDCRMRSELASTKAREKESSVMHPAIEIRGRL